MGSKRGWPQALKRRCEAVGWSVEIAQSGHYRAKTHDGQVFTFANTPSSSRSERHALAQAKRLGLDELEEQRRTELEHMRLERIEIDRKNGVDWDAENEMMENHVKITAETEGSLGYVNGVAVAECVPAVASHPRSPDRKVPIKHGQELLLVDESVIYRCTYEITRNGIQQDCGRYFEVPNSLRSHIAWHARADKKEVANETTTITDDAKSKAVNAQSVKERIANLKEGESITVKADVEVEKVDFFDDPRADEDEKTTVTPSRTPEVIEKRPGIISRLVSLADELDDLADESQSLASDIAEIAESVRVKRNELRKLLAELPQHIADDETLAKARKYDEITKITS